MLRLRANPIRLYYLALLLAFTRTGLAQAQATDEERALAEALFRDAKELMEVGQPASACPKLAESQKLDPGGGTQLLLGLCWEEAGMLASAQVELSEALATAKRDNNANRERVAREHLDGLEPRLARLRLQFAEGPRPPGLRITRSGTEFPEAAWDTAIPLDPGTYQLELLAPGFQSIIVEVTIQGEGTVTTAALPALLPLDGQVSPAATSSDPGQNQPEGPNESGASSRAIWGWTLAGVGVAATTIGSVFGIQAMTSNREVNEACPEKQCDVPGMESKHEDAGRFATISTIAMSAGVVSIATGLYLLLTDSKPSEGQPSARVPRGLSVGWVVGAQHGELNVGGSF